MTLGGVVPNPRLSLVYEGIGLCRKENVDFILAVGGGSVIDSAKAIGYGMANEGDVWDFYAKKRMPQGCLPLGVVLTIAAAGSEMSNSSVITKEEGWVKRGCNSDFARPRFAVMNPELTMTLPAYQTESGCVDIMMHTMERYLNQSENMELTDGISECLIRTVMKNARILLEDPRNYEARAEVMWAGSLSHNGLTGCGTDGGDWASHQLEHELGGMYDVAHGAGLAAVWGSWARYVMNARPDRFSAVRGAGDGRKRHRRCDGDCGKGRSGDGGILSFHTDAHQPERAWGGSCGRRAAGAGKKMQLRRRQDHRLCEEAESGGYLPNLSKRAVGGSVQGCIFPVPSIKDTSCTVGKNRGTIGEIMDRKEILRQKKRIVIKVGTTTITYEETGNINLEKLEKFVRILINLRNKGKEVIVVSSGAVGSAGRLWGLTSGRIRRRPSRPARRWARPG